MRLGLTNLHKGLRGLWHHVIAQWDIHVLCRWWDLRDFFCPAADEDTPLQRPHRSNLLLERLEIRWLMSTGVTEFTVPTANSQPQSITVGPDNKLWFTENNAAKIAKLTTGGTFTEYSLGTGHHPYDIATGPGGKLWFTDVVNGQPSGNGYFVGNITTSGTITEYQVSTGGGGGVLGLTWAQGADGNVWVIDGFDNKIAKVTSGGSITTYTIPTANSGPQDIVAGTDGALWFAESSGNKIGRVTTSGSFTEYTLPTSGSQPNYLAVGSDGNTWFTELGGNRIGRITPGGTITEWTIPTFSSSPEGIAAGPDGALWFVENSTQKVGRITTSGTITEVATLFSGSNPTDLVTGPDNNLWFTENASNKIAKLSWIPQAYIRTNDPMQSYSLPFGLGTIYPQTGNVHVEVPLDYRQSVPM